MRKKIETNQPFKFFIGVGSLSEVEILEELLIKIFGHANLLYPDINPDYYPLFGEFWSENGDVYHDGVSSSYEFNGQNREITSNQLFWVYDYEELESFLVEIKNVFHNPKVMYAPRKIVFE